MLKSAKKIYNIGELILVIGSALYLVDLLTKERFGLTLPISIIYAVAVVLIVIGWVGTRDERREEKAKLKAEKRA